MTIPSERPARLPVWDDRRIMVPDEVTWRAMSQTERDAFVERMMSAFDQHREAMVEGTRHSRPKTRATADLEDHFRRSGRRVFLASELAVMYPGEAVVVPDLTAVVDCDPDLELDSWSVVDQGRGVDVVIEFRNLGRKHKDLRENVRDYARLRIPEYFSFDVRSQTLRGWRLGAVGARTYQPIAPQGARVASRVLELELAPGGMRLRFYANGEVIPTAQELATRLQRMADEQTQTMKTLQRERDDALGRAAQAQTRIIQMILGECETRGVTLDAEQHATILVETDIETLLGWFARSRTVATGAALLGEE